LYSRAPQIRAAAEDDRSIYDEMRNLWPARFEAPIVVLVGDRDRHVAPASHGQALLREPGVRGIGICEAAMGHMLHLEAPEAVAASVRLADRWADGVWEAGSAEVEGVVREAGLWEEYEAFKREETGT
jgi:pimeloyl-ACP methyl ester carboxylesterase